MAPKAKGKKGAKEKKDKKSDKASSKTSSPAKSESAASTPAPVAPKAPDASADFEAGVLFNKYDKSGAGILTADEFRAMYREAKENLQAGPVGPSAVGSPLSGAATSNMMNGMGAPMNDAERKLSFSSVSADGHVAFEAGKVFAQFDADRDGKIDKMEFERLVKNHPELLRGGTQPTQPQMPVEVVSGRLLTHFDETAGVAIPRTSVEEHRAMGNQVTPLVEAYKARYEKLRMALTSKLFPRREYILQLRRQLTNTSAEVAASRTAIERDTKTDTDQILERLRAVESMRQSSITHQVLQLDEELQAIERTVRRVEQANDSRTKNATGVSNGISLVTTSAALGNVPLESVRAPQAALMVEVIQQFNDLISSVDKLSNKRLEVNVDYNTDDFPKETQERLEIIARCDRYAHALSVKDHMLWTALKEKEKLEERVTEEQQLSSEYAAEMAQWAELSQDLSQQVAQLKQNQSESEMEVAALKQILRDHNIYVSDV
jgi:hypothetical protein